MSESILVTPRRNFLIRALGFTAAGATVSVPIITVADAKARIEHHRRELAKATHDYYGPTYLPRDAKQAAGREWDARRMLQLTSSEMGHARWVVRKMDELLDAGVQPGVPSPEIEDLYRRWHGKIA